MKIIQKIGNIVFIVGQVSKKLIGFAFLLLCSFGNTEIELHGDVESVYERFGVRQVLRLPDHEVKLCMPTDALIGIGVARN